MCDRQLVSGENGRIWRSYIIHLPNLTPNPLKVKGHRQRASGVEVHEDPWPGRGQRLAQSRDVNARCRLPGVSFEEVAERVSPFVREPQEQADPGRVVHGPIRPEHALVVDGPLLDAAATKQSGKRLLPRWIDELLHEAIEQRA